MRDPGERQEGVRPAGLHERLTQPQAMRDRHVVVGEAVDQHERSNELRRVQHNAVVGIHLRVQAQEALGVAGVVQRPVSRGRARAGCGERVRSVEHRERGEESAVRPADHRHALEIRLRQRPCSIVVPTEFAALGRASHPIELVDRTGQRMHCVHLIGQTHALHLQIHFAIPHRSAPGRAAAVRNHHKVALVGPPLRVQVGGPAHDHLLVPRSAVRMHEHRQLGGAGEPARRARRHNRREQLTFTESHEAHVRHEVRFGGDIAHVVARTRALSPV